jgi:D-glycero-D-manno-heptose 1,7-bisphosphate phosphatase
MAFDINAERAKVGRYEFELEGKLCSIPVDAKGVIPVLATDAENAAWAKYKDLESYEAPSFLDFDFDILIQQKLVILDKDGTLTETFSGKEFVQNPEDQKLLTGVAERISELKAAGYALAIASNQGGVAKGHKSLEDAMQEMRYCMGISGIDAAYFCPDFEGKICYRITWNGREYTDPEKFTPNDFSKSGESIVSFRKPDAGMLQVAKLFRQLCLVNPEDDVEAIMIGDRPEDQQAAAAAGISFVDAEAWRNGAMVLGSQSFVI